VIEWDNGKIFVRQNETINMDYTVGFYPDLVVVKGEESEYLTHTVQSKSREDFFYDSVTRIAIGLVTKKISPRQYKTFLASLPRRHIFNHPYQEFALPPPEYRLLTLSKLWGAFQFLTLKSTVMRPKTELLELFIPKFLNAATEMDYAVIISEFVNEIRSCEGNIGSTVLESYLRLFIPPLQLTEDTIIVENGSEK
jgi:hypothetical protein